MAKSAWFHHSEAGYRSVLRDHSTQAECMGVAQSLALNAEKRGGGPYRCDVIPGQYRAHARATTATTGAFWREVRTRALSRSIPRKGQWSDSHRTKWHVGYAKAMAKRKGR